MFLAGSNILSIITIYKTRNKVQLYRDELVICEKNNNLRVEIIGEIILFCHISSMPQNKSCLIFIITSKQINLVKD